MTLNDLTSLALLSLCVWCGILTRCVVQLQNVVARLHKPD